MARALPSPSESVVLVRTLDENLAKHALMRTHGKSNAPPTMLVMEGSLKDLPESFSDSLEAVRGNTEAPTLVYDQDEHICGARETEGGFCLVGKDGPVATTFKHVVCAPDTMESPLRQLLRTSSQTGSGALSEASESSLDVYELQTHAELENWMDMGEQESSLQQSPSLLATPAAEEDSDDGEDDAQPLHVSLELAQDLLELMQTVEEEGGAHEKDAKEADKLARRLSHIRESKEAATFSADDVCFLRDYFGEYLIRLDDKRSRLQAEGASNDEQWVIYDDIGRTFTMMGSLVQVRHESTSHRLTTAEAAQLGILDDFDSDGGCESLLS